MLIPLFVEFMTCSVDTAMYLNYGCNESLHRHCIASPRQHNTSRYSDLLAVLGSGTYKDRKAWKRDYFIIQFHVPFKIISLVSRQAISRWGRKREKGARWLSGKATDSGSRGLEFKPHDRPVVSWGKTLYLPKKLVIKCLRSGDCSNMTKNCWTGRSRKIKTQKKMEVTQ